MPGSPTNDSVSPQRAGFVRYRQTGSSAGLAEALEGVRPELIRLAR